jgi:hypothetical protein
MRAFAAEVIRLAPDVIVANTPPVLAAVQQETRSLPIVFIQVGDPVGVGFVQSLARPGGNTTGFTNFEFAMGQKWLEILKEMGPAIRRVGVVLMPEHAPNAGQLRVIEAAASSFGVQVTPAGGCDASAMERAIEAFARSGPTGRGALTLCGHCPGRPVAMPHLSSLHARTLSDVLTAFLTSGEAVNEAAAIHWTAQRCGSPAACGACEQTGLPVVGYLGPTSVATATFFVGFRDGDMLRVKTWQSNTAGRRVNSIDCRSWRPSWSVVRWWSLSHPVFRQS